MSCRHNITRYSTASFKCPFFNFTVNQHQSAAIWLLYVVCCSKSSTISSVSTCTQRSEFVEAMGTEMCLK